MRSLLRAIALATCILSPLSLAEDGEEGPSGEDGEVVPSAPEPAGEPENNAQVTAALSSLDKSWLFSKANAGLEVVDLRTGEEVYSHNAEWLLNPASTMKVVTSATALRNLGPSYRFTTDVFYDGELEPGGTLKGNLYIKGHGDPTFVSEKLWKMVGEIELMGVQRVEGSVIFDDSFHQGPSMIPGWDKPEDLEKGTSYFASLSALSINANTVVMVVRPGAEVGSVAQITLELPVHGYVQFDNQVKTGAPGTRKFVEVEREVLPDATKFTLTGTVPVDDLDRTWIRRTVADPTAHFMAAFREQMDEQDIDVEGKFIRGTTPTEAEMLLSLDSPPLSQVLADMNKSSLNFVAEQVLRTVGAEIAGEGSTQAGIGVVSQYLASIGVAPNDVVLVNGSGLSHDGKLKPTALTKVLVDMARDPRVGSEFSASLAISGTDGTLWSRLREDPGRLRGKTGTLDEVHCLTGYIDSQSGKRYAFAFLVNNYGTRLQAVRDAHDAFARQMFVLP